MSLDKKGLSYKRKENKQMKIKDLEDCILDRITLVQTNHLELIPSSISVHNEYGLSRYFRGGPVQTRRH